MLMDRPFALGPPVRRSITFAGPLLRTVERTRTHRRMALDRPVITGQLASKSQSTTSAADEIPSPAAGLEPNQQTKYTAVSPTAAGPDVLIQRAVALDGDPSPGRMKRRHVLQYDGIEYCGLPVSRTKWGGFSG